MEKWLALAGRILFAPIFIMSGLHHITAPGQMEQYASSMGVPAAKLMIVLTGLMILAGGVSILFGFWTKLGALLIIIFLVVVTPWMHRPLSDQMQFIMFMKNISMLGGALIIAAFGPGDISIDKKQ
jgi:putative oxidoreductase